jgi:hypothetical protein
VGNVVYQMEALLSAAEASIQGRTFHYSDYAGVVLNE